MRRLLLAFTASSLSLTAAACGDDATQPADTTASDTTTPDTAAEDTATPDGDNPDTMSDDTASSDTMSEDAANLDTMSDDVTVADTANPDTMSDDTTTPDTMSDDTSTTDTGAEDTAAPSRCACEGGASCIEANAPDGCPLVTSTCTGGLSIADSCDESDAMAVCVRSATTRVWDYAQTSGWLASAASACDDGTFTVTAIPEGVGDVCSCQRSAGACVQTYGDACDSLSCDAGVQAAACSDTGRRPERCVTRDGQREFVFYASAGISATQAETICLGASANVLYWYPAFD